jgi:membrane protein DedA with SNARE-associated domain
VTSLPAILQHAAPYLHEYGIWAVFIGLLLETFGLPIPGETLLIAASLLATQGHIQLPVLLAAAWLAAVLGDNLAFYLGRFGGRRLLLRYGTGIGITRRRLSKMHRFYDRFGPEVVIVARFFVIARQLNGLVAGSSGMLPLRFFIYNVLGAALWVGTWGMAAWFLGEHLVALLAWVTRAAPIALAIGAALVLFVYLARRRWLRLRPSNETD